MKSVRQIIRTRQGKLFLGSVTAVVALGVGIGVQAAISQAHFEAEAGTVSANASKFNDTTASGGSAVRFASSSGGGCSTSVLGDPGGPDPWGGCWPGASNTGVPAGTTLQRVPLDITSGNGWVWDSGSKEIDVTGNNAVISCLDVAGGFYVSATGVTIKNSKFYKVGVVSNARYCHSDEDPYIKTITGCTNVSGIGTATNDPRLTLQDSEIDCHGVPGNTGTGVLDRNMNVYRMNIHGCENGFDSDSYTVIEDSYIHDLYNSSISDPHTDGLQSGVGAYLTLRHNVFYAFTGNCVYPNDNGSCNGTSAIGFGAQPDRSSVINLLVTRNLLAGGAYTMYCSIQPPTNFQIIENYFSTVYSPRVGEYGHTADCTRGEITSGNVIFNYANKTTAPFTFE